ncbi:WLM domain-containing protein [Terfezia claveryi]|nr:WLM domain-containing protein [Terfezia claveryi]
MAEPPPPGNLSSSVPSNPRNDDDIPILISHRSATHTLHLPPTSTISDLTILIESTFSIPPAYQKLLAPKLGILKDLCLPITSLPAGKKLTLMGSSPTEVASVQNASKSAKSNIRRFGGKGSPIPAARPAPRASIDPKRAHDDAVYTFLELRPLRYLPNPEKSLKYLERVRDDTGIRAVMRRYKWTVPLLLEMNPAEHTTHESKILGLNRNKGEVIELRIRTDDYGGYRDYKTVRRTVVHELCHNVYSGHDRNFWDLYRQLEGEMGRADWSHGGNSLGGEFYEPPGGGVGGGGQMGAWGEGTREGEGLSMREVLLRAVEERMKGQRGGGGGAGTGEGSSSGLS